MRLSISIKFAVICALLVVFAGGTSYLMLNRFVHEWEQALIDRDRELAKVLAGLRTGGGQLDFRTIGSFVESSDRADTGLVYAIVVDRAGAMVQGSLNPRLFGSLDTSFKTLVLQGRQRVLRQLVSGKVDRRGKIKETKFLVPAGRLHLGFDLWRIDQRVEATNRTGLMILVSALALGILVSFILARWLTAPVKRLSGAMQAVAKGDNDQSVQVSSMDELAVMASSFNQMTQSLRQKNMGREYLRRYLSPSVTERILKEGNALEMTPEERNATVLCLGFPGVTTIGGRFKSMEALKLLNDYLASAIDAITDHGGVVIQIDSTRLLAVWGAPGPVKEAEQSAIRGAQAVMKGAAVEARRQSAADGKVIEPAIGIAAGRVVAGNLGSARRVAYTVMGNAVELAENIEKLARPGEILVSEAAFAKVRGQFQAAAAAPLILEGMEEAVPLYRLE